MKEKQGKRYNKIGIILFVSLPVFYYITQITIKDFISVNLFVELLICYINVMLYITIYVLSNRQTKQISFVHHSSLAGMLMNIASLIFYIFPSIKSSLNASLYGPEKYLLLRKCLHYEVFVLILIVLIFTLANLLDAKDNGQEDKGTVS